MTCISIGILAHNEADVIQAALLSLLTQTIFDDPQITVEVIVVANGCSDGTEAIAQTFIQQSADWLSDRNTRWKVCTLPEPGFANAWNTFTHQLSSSSADYLFSMNADIQLLEPTTFSSMVQILEDCPEAWVAVDKKLKDVAFKANKTLADRVSLRVSKISGERAITGGPAWISGQLYCARAGMLRKLWLPLTLPTDDSFIYTMVVTNFLTEPPDPKRVLLAPAAAHTFEAYTGIKRLFKHEKWLIYGVAVNEILYSYLRGMAEAQNVCLFIQKQNKDNPAWLDDLIQEATLHRFGWFIPPFVLTRRFQSLRSKPLLKALLMLPLSTAAFLVDATLALQVNATMNRNAGLSTWGKSGSWGKK